MYTNVYQINQTKFKFKYLRNKHQYNFNSMYIKVVDLKNTYVCPKIHF